MGHLPVSETLALGVLAPFVLVGVFTVLRSVRKRLMGERK
jgi:uncharacterized membrane-anchored protein